MGKLKEQNIEFVYIKATEGSTIQDDKFAVNWENAEKAGLLSARIISFPMTAPAAIRRRTLSKRSVMISKDVYCR